MRVLAVVTPPEPLLRELVSAFGLPTQPRHRAGPPPTGGGGSLTRSRLDVAPLLSGEVALRVAALGNLAGSEVSGMLGSWAHHPVRGALVHVAGLGVDEARGAVVASLSGDLDAVHAVVDHFKRVAQRRGILLDRRDFRAEVVIGSVLAADVVAARRALATVPVPVTPWRIGSISLVQETFAAEAGAWRELARLPLEPA